MRTASEVINYDISRFEKQEVPINPVFARTQKDIIELIDHYWMDRYRDGAYDALGLKKCFYNVIESPTMVAAKMTDLDTKDIRISAVDGSPYWYAWIMGKDLNFWMKDKGWGERLNEIVYNLPKYGHIIVKKFQDNIEIVPLQNIINDPLTRTILESERVIEKHLFTPDQLRAKNWDNVEKAIKKYAKEGKIRIYELHGPVDFSKNNYFIVATYPGADSGEVLVYDKIDRDDLYRELKWEEVAGRALGRGQVEKLFEAQIHLNKVAHYKDRGLHWTSKHIYQTRDSNFEKNLSVDVEDGRVLIVNSEITPITVEERNLPAYNAEEQRWDALIDKRTFAFDVVRGERTPAGTPLGSAILQTQMAGGFFDLKRENIGNFLKDIFFDWVIPPFKKDRKKRHKLMISEFDEFEISKLRELSVDSKLKRKIIDRMIRGQDTSLKAIELLKQVISQQVNSVKQIEVPENVYDNLKYKIDIIITGEQIDVASRLTTLQTILQILGSNPAVLQNPQTRKVFLKMIDLAGFNPSDFEVEEPTGIVPVPQIERGGSIARPMASRPAELNVPTTL